MLLLGDVGDQQSFDTSLHFTDDVFEMKGKMTSSGDDGRWEHIFLLQANIFASRTPDSISQCEWDIGPSHVLWLLSSIPEETRINSFKETFILFG